MGEKSVRPYKPDAEKGEVEKKCTDSKRVLRNVEKGAVGMKRW